MEFWLWMPPTAKLLLLGIFGMFVISMARFGRSAHRLYLPLSPGAVSETNRRRFLRATWRNQIGQRSE